MRAGQLTKWRAVGAGVLAGILSAGGVCLAANGAADSAEAKYMSGQLVEQARRTLRDTNLNPVNAAHAAAILLQFARKLDGNDVRTLKMLAEAAQAAGDMGLRKETLRELIKQDPGDFVAQVQYLDLLAGATEVMEDRARIYQSAMDQAAFDPQIRSEMAERLAQIADERGALDQEKKYLGAAVGFNDVNVPALRGLTRLAARNPNATAEQLGALVSLLVADPYQPDAWVQLARICERVNLHDRAAAYLQTALEQMQWDGAAPSGELYLEMIMEFAIVGRAEAPQMARGLTNLPDVPLSALVVAELAADAPGAAPVAATTQAANESVPAKIEKLLAGMVKQGAEGDAQSQANALADAAVVALTIMPQVNADAGNWVEGYAKLVAPDDATLARLRGWQLYRDGKLDEARAALEKVAGSDPMAQVGLARVMIDQGKKDEAARQLQDIWSSHPTGLLALQVAQTARRGEITLVDTVMTKQLAGAAGRLSNAVLTAHRQPRESMLISAVARKSTFVFGEAMTLSIRMTNGTQKALPVGSAGVAVTTIGLAATTRGGDETSLGLYALEDLQRVYRLEPQGVVDATIRADQGKLLAVLERNPTQALTVQIEFATAPRVNGKNEMTPGLGGQLIQVGEIQRTAWAWDQEKLPQELLTTEGEARLAKIQAIGDMLASPQKEGTRGLGSPDKVKAVVSTLLPLAKSDDPLVRAALIEAIPAVKPPEEVVSMMNALSSDADSLVRLHWANWAAATARQGDSAMAASLEKRAGEEKDPLVKEWMDLQLQHTKVAAAQSAK